MALKLTDDQTIAPPDTYDDIDLVTYSAMQNKTKPKPYVAAVVTSSRVDDNAFILGDGRITDDPASRTTNDYFNGALEPGSSYKIFQRIIVNEKVASSPLVTLTWVARNN